MIVGSLSFGTICGGVAMLGSNNVRVLIVFLCMVIEGLLPTSSI